MGISRGTVLAGRFRVVDSPLGSGESGVVVPAVDLKTGRDVAVKLLHPHLVGDSDALGQLQREASTMGRLRHPHVVEVVGLWANGPGEWVLVTERVQGVSLDQSQDLAGPQAALRWGLQLAAALREAHRLGIVHGDLRPGNVLVGLDGAKLFDFGVHRLDAPVHPGQTAPEVLAGGPPGVPSDLYGLGLVLHMALHGRMPWSIETGSGDAPWALVRQQQQIPEVQGPRGLASLIRALLDPDPTARPANASVVLSALERLQGDPDRKMGFRRWRPSPWRPGRAWIVHGTDPGTGGPAVIRHSLSASAARRLAERLRSEGWMVQAEREALSASDGLWFALAAVVGAWLVPLLGAVPAVAMAVVWRSRFTRPQIRKALPAVSVHLPEEPAPPGQRQALAASALLLLAAGLVWFAPALALVPAVLLVGLAALGHQTANEAPADAARRAHIQAAFAEVRGLIEDRESDEVLGIAGAVDALEGAWQLGDLDGDSVLVRIDRLHKEAARATLAVGDSGQAPAKATPVQVVPPRSLSTPS